MTKSIEQYEKEIEEAWGKGWRDSEEHWDKEITLLKNKNQALKAQCKQMAEALKKIKCRHNDCENMEGHYMYSVANDALKKYEQMMKGCK